MPADSEFASRSRSTTIWRNNQRAFDVDLLSIPQDRQLQGVAGAQGYELTSERDEIRDLLVAHAQDQVIDPNAGL